MRFSWDATHAASDRQPLLVSRSGEASPGVLAVRADEQGLHDRAVMVCINNCAEARGGEDSGYLGGVIISLRSSSAFCSSSCSPLARRSTAAPRHNLPVNVGAGFTQVIV